MLSKPPIPYMNTITRKITTPQEFDFGFFDINELSNGNP